MRWIALALSVITLAIEIAEDVLTALSFPTLQYNWPHLGRMAPFVVAIAALLIAAPQWLRRLAFFVNGLWATVNLLVLLGALFSVALGNSHHIPVVVVFSFGIWNVAASSANVAVLRSSWRFG